MIIRAGWSNATLGGILAIVTHDLNKLKPLDSQTEGELTGIWHSSLTLQQNKHGKRSSWQEKYILIRFILLTGSLRGILSAPTEPQRRGEPAWFFGGTVACFKKSEWPQGGPYPEKSTSACTSERSASNWSALLMMDFLMSSECCVASPM